MSRIEEALAKAAKMRVGVQKPVQQNEPIATAVVETVASVPLPPLPEQVLVSPENPLLVTINDPHSPAAEEYRKIKSTLVKLTKQEQFDNVLMVTSCIANEGKSLTAVNLAVSLAQEHDHTVLLIDADLRRPMINKYLGFAPQFGLTDYLQHSCDIGDLISPTGIGRLSVISAGNPVRNPVELFSSQRMKDFVAEVKQRYPDRFVIFDAPPLLPFAETNFLAHIVDGVLFVIKERGVTEDNVHEAMNTLKGANVLGFIYNNAEIGLHDDRYYYYRGYYQ